MFTLARGDERRERLGEDHGGVREYASCRRQSGLSKSCCEQRFPRRIVEGPPLKPDVEGDRAADDEPQRGIGLVVCPKRVVENDLQRDDAEE
jgi:hypothetical protein